MFRESLLVPLIVVCLFAGISASTVSAQSEKTTEGSLRVVGIDSKKPQLCPLKSTKVTADVRGFVSRVRVTQSFQNPFDRAIEAVYTFPLPNDAAVDDMTILIGDRTIKGKIMERQKAREAYDNAKQEGKVAALLDQERPNIFTQSVANITANAEIKVVIEYVETLKYRDDAYEFTFPMTIGQRYIPSSVGEADAARISPKSKERPGHTISIDLDIDAGVPIQDISSRTHLISAQQFSPTAYKVSLTQEDEIPNRDFVVKYKTAGTKIDDAILASKDDRGGFFTLILQPPDKVMPQDTMPKEIVFVLDTSGSMEGFPIKKAKEAMNLTLAGLNPSDTFNLITFAGETKILFEKPVLPTPENMSLARKMLDDSDSGGGTEMMKAIKAALEPSGSQDHVRIVCFMTDGEVGNDYEIISEVQKHPNARVFAFGIGESVNHFLLDEISREGRGQVEYVGLDDDGSAAAKRFYERIRNPILTDISLDFEGVQVEDVLPKSIPDLFDAMPVNVVGRYTQGGNGKLVLNGKMHGQPFRREIAIELPTAAAPDSSVFPTLWARRKVADLMRKDYTGLQTDKFQGDLQATVTDLGLRFRLLTPFTSFVAVDENVVTDGSPTPRVDVPVAAPANAPAAAVSASGPPVTAQNYPPNLPGVSGVAEMVTVDVESSSAQSSSCSSSVVESRILTNLPLNGRSVQSLVLLTPGVAGARVTSTADQRTVGGQPAGTQFSVDGRSSNLGVQPDSGSLSKNIGSIPTLTASGGTNGLLAADSTEEVTISTSAVEVGRTSGVQVNLTTKSGSNSFHGSLFETFGNDALNANDFFANSRVQERAPAQLNQFGGTLGGYFVKDKAFFFTSYEGLRQRKPGFTVSEVPGLESRQLASPFMRAILDAFPIANGSVTANGLAEFAAGYSNPADHDVFGLRVDGHINDKVSVSGSYNFANSGAAVRGNGNLSLNTIRQFDTRASRFTGKLTYLASASIVVEGSINFSRNRLTQTFTMDDFGGATLDPSITASPFSMLRMELPGQNAAFAAAVPIAADINQVAPAAQLSWVHDNHTFKFGGEFLRLAYKVGGQSYERSATFSGVVGTGLADRINEVERAVEESSAATELSAYAADDWRLTHNLNLNLSVRWEGDVAPDSAGNLVIGSASTHMPNSLGNFAPRVAVAYDIFGNGHSTFRAGAGLYFDHGASVMSESFANSYPTALGRYARATNFASQDLDPFTPLIVFANGLRKPRSWQVYGEFQQELFGKLAVTAAYQGFFGRALYQTRTFVDGEASPRYVRQIDNSGSSNRHEGRLTVDRRFSSGFAVFGRYTFAKSTDNLFSDSFGTSFSSADTAVQHAASDSDVRHDVSFWGTYTIPTFFNSGWVKSFAKDWTVSGFVNARSGFPINVTYIRAGDFFNELVRPDVVPNVPRFITVDGIRALNPDAFQVPDGGGQGSLSRNSLRGFPFFQLNASLSRKFRLASESTLELRVEAFNLLNNTNFADSDGNLGTLFPEPGFVPNHYFGQSLSTYGGRTFTPFYLYGGPRSVQLSAKFSF